MRSPHNVMRISFVYFHLNKLIKLVEIYPAYPFRLRRIFKYWHRHCDRHICSGFWFYLSCCTLHALCNYCYSSKCGILVSGFHGLHFISQTIGRITFYRACYGTRQIKAKKTVLWLQIILLCATNRCPEKCSEKLWIASTLWRLPSWNTRKKYCR